MMGEYAFGIAILVYFGLVAYMWDVESDDASEDTKDEHQLNTVMK